jgi:hypothetical protein
METNETIQPHENEPVFNLNNEAQTYLKEAGKWANFLSIVGFVMCGLLVIAALFVGTIFSALSNISPVYGQVPAAAAICVSVFIILVDLLYFFFALYLNQFAGKIKRGIAFTDVSQVTQGLGKLKSFFKLWGIVTIVVLCIYALEIIFFFVAVVAASHH